MQRRPQDGAAGHATVIPSLERRRLRATGQREEYLVKALHDYKSNLRVGGGVAAMAEVAYPLSEEEIIALAHYLAHL